MNDSAIIDIDWRSFMKTKKLTCGAMCLALALLLPQAFILPMPAVEIKKYKSRWGACYPKINKVSFNLALVHLNYELIDYVIVHELCHFLQPNHSKQFYQEIKKRLPNYKQCEKKLKEIGI